MADRQRCLDASFPSPSVCNRQWSVSLPFILILTSQVAYCSALLPHDSRCPQSALFNFQSLLLVVLLLVCTCTYARAVAPRLIDRNKDGYVNLILSLVLSPSPLIAQFVYCCYLLVLASFHFILARFAGSSD